MSDMVKFAFAPATLAAMAKATKGFGSGAGMGGALGAAGGAILGGVHNFRDAREHGASGGQAALSGLAGVGKGAVRGAVTGALVGGTAGAAAPTLASQASSLTGLGSASRFGQRQIHSLTGVGDAAYVRSIGGGAADARERLVGSTKGLRDAPDAAGRARAMGDVRDARRSFQAAEKSEAAGLTSIPGFLRAAGKDPIGTLSTGLKGQWHSAGAGGKALMFGAPVAGAANELRKGEDSSGKERGRFERAGRIFGGAASGMVAPLAITGDVAAGGMLSSGLGNAGKFVDRAYGRLQKRRQPEAVSQQEPGGGTTQASGYEVSERAAGSAAESVTG